jgi:putative Holliday junction resolvase
MILGIDPGSRRVGVAIADPQTRWARPLEVIDCRADDPIARIARLVDELKVVEIVVGKPLSLSGTEGPAAEEQQRFVTALREAVGVEVTEFDERLTTVIADQALRASGTTTRRGRALRDAVAAQVMLQGYLDKTS